MTELFSRRFLGSDKIVQFKYFTDQFKDEKYEIHELIIDNTVMKAILSIDSFDNFHVSMLFLDRITQSLGFTLIQYIRHMQRKPVRFLFIRHLQWDFSGPVRPSRPLYITAEYSYNTLTAKIERFEIHGAVNKKAQFKFLVDVISPK
ncbi:hypothetical protein [Ochrobactrum sp. SFR4]|uniref:hypothetical protein n=1 Tax=Ochrobactrum sp. SFR4 TaxID=2717368 RepID=UPI001C8B89C7|nr:hypothetical protein [Ochrobactrum sp. SFR4]MBX8827190.1 hypothetical protein [Ochrobactrum sp. SFR4]